MKKPFNNFFSENNSYISNNDDNEVSNRNEIKVEDNNNNLPNLLLTPKNNRIHVIYEDEEKNNENNFHSIDNTKKLNDLKIPNIVQNILYNNDDISLDEQKKIYNKFKNKFPFYRNKLNEQLNFPPFNSESPTSYLNLSKQFLNKTKKKKIKFKNNSRNINYNLNGLLQTVNDLRTLRDKSKINKNFLSENNLIKQIKDESNFMTPKLKLKKRVVLSPHEVFYYDAKKWNKNGNSPKNLINDIHFKEINKQIDDTIKEMKNKVIILNQEIFQIEDYRNKMKSQKILTHVKSKSFKNFKNIFFSNEERRKNIRRYSKIFY